MFRIRLFSLAMVTALTAAARSNETESTDVVSFDKQIQPIFQAQCHGCHQPAKAKGDYSMTSFDELMAGGESGDKAVVPSKPDESYLVELITPVDGEAEMPQGKPPLSDQQIALIRKWIEQGATNDSPDDNVRFNRENPPVYTAPPVITSLDFSPDGELLAVAGFHEIVLHKADGSGVVGRLIGLSARISSVEFSPDGKFLAAAGGLPARMGEVQVWDVQKQELALSHTVTYDTLYGARWSPDGKLISFGCASDNTVRVIEAATGKQVLFQGAHGDWPLDTVFSAKGTHVLSVSRDRSVKLTELKTQRFIDNVTSITPGALKGGLSGIDGHPERDEVLVGGADGVPKIYRIFRTSKRVIGDDANLIRKFPKMRGRIFDVAISRDGSRVAAVSSLDGTGQIRVYSYEFNTQLPADVLKIMEKRIYQRSAAEQKKLAEFRKQDVKQLAEADVAESGLFAVAFSADAKIAATAGSDGLVRLIDSETGHLVHSFVPVPVTPAESAVSVRASGDRPWRRSAQVKREQLPTGAKIVGLQVEPKTATISSPYGVVQFVITAELADGSQLDVTRMVDAKLSSDSFQISDRGMARALGDGSGKVAFSVGGQSVAAEIVAAGVEAEFHPHFIRDVTPAISKLGCNAGTCHGANKGKAGFKLSLRGNDPLFDVRAFADDHAARRVNFASPSNSLMLMKASARVPHEGGQVTAPGEPYYEIIRQWIGDGAKLDLSGSRVDRIEIFPKNPTVQREGASQQFRIVATYTDASTRDVTHESYIETGDIEIALHDKGGLLTTLRRGEAPVLARYEGRYAATTLTVMGDRSEFVWQNQPAFNEIDKFTADKWQRMKILPSNLCTDADFIRRVHLDLTGLPPTSEEVRAFTADDRDTKVKRDELVDRLIGSEPFIEHWTNKWADLLQVNRKFLAPEGSVAFRKWIRDEVAANTPYDKFVHKILTAAGSNKDNPAASYFKITRTPQDTMENTTQLFLAIRFNCNKCHDHPFERWTQDQYYETAAWFAQFELKKDPASGKREIGKTAVERGKPLYEIVADKSSGEVTHDRTGEVTPPAFPFVATFDAQEKSPRREKLAAWITSADNQYFAKSYVNRLWGYMFGRGLIDPIDDIRAGNPPTNPGLLEWLTAQFLKSDFNARHMMALICKSRTYQLSIETNRWNEDDTVNYSRFVPRRLPAEVLYDAIHRVTGSQLKLPGVQPGMRAAQLPDAGVKLPDGFLSTFGRPARESACECERSSGVQLGPVLAMVSGPTVENAVSDGGNALAKLVTDVKDDEELVNEIFMRVLNRPAAKEEIVAGVAAIRELPMDHDRLRKELADYQKSLEPLLAKREAARQAKIDAAQQQLTTYEKEIAPRETELDRQQQERIAKATANLQAYEQQLPEKQRQWAELLKVSTVWSPLDPIELTAQNNTKLTKEKDLSVIASGPNGKGTYKFVAKPEGQKITGIRLELLADERLPAKGPGRADNGNFVLTEFRVESAPEGKPNEKKPVVLQNAQADFSQQSYDVKTAIDGKQDPANNGWAASPKLGVNHVAVFETKEDLGAEPTLLTFHLDQKFQDGKHTVGRFRISVTSSPRPVRLDGPPKNVATILAIAEDKRDDKQRAELTAYYRTVDAELKKLTAAVAAAKKPRPVDPQLQKLRDGVTVASKPLPVDPKLAQLRRDIEISKSQLGNVRLTAAQDIAWALINSPAFLFNR